MCDCPFNLHFNIQPMNTSNIDTPTPQLSTSQHGQDDQTEHAVALQQEDNIHSTEGQQDSLFHGDIVKLVQLRSEEQLKEEFEENEKKLTELSSNIEDLFRKISTLTDQVTAECTISPNQSGISAPQEPHLSEISQNSTNTVAESPLQVFPLSLPQRLLEETSGFSMRMFETGKVLGHGKFGEVLFCRHKESGTVFGLKKILKATVQQYQMRDQILMELQACKMVDHPNIMKSYAAFTDQFHIFLLCQFLAGEKLVRRLGCAETEAREVIRQVLRAIEHLHEKKIAHRDLKPQNIIIDQSGSIKVCDLGWSHVCQPNQTMNTVCGTLDYVCPEMASNQQYDLRVDLWSLGVLTYELIYKKVPFRGQNRSDTFQRVKEQELCFPASPEVSSQCLDFITRLLKPQKQRMLLSAAKQHDFLAETGDKAISITQSLDYLFE